MKEEETALARSAVTSLMSFAACLRDEEPRHLGWIAEAERWLLKQPRSVEVRVPEYLGWVSGQKREVNGVGRVPPSCADTCRPTESPYR